jgi:nicotinate phosphoribosyltransferase
MSTSSIPEWGLHTEFYQLVQAAVYHADGLWGEATFDLTVRQLPTDLSHVVLAGVEDAIDAALLGRVSEDEIAWLAAEPGFSSVPATFFSSLRNFRFTGDIAAMPEGSIAFPGEPVLRVTGPLHQVGLLETRLLQWIGHCSGVATRAARIVGAASGTPVVDFGSRRTANAAAAGAAVRAAWIGGCVATTNAHGAHIHGLPPWGVMSDALIAAYGEDRLAYEAFAGLFPSHCHVNLPDGDLGATVSRLRGLPIDVVRLDSPTLGADAPLLRAALDNQGMGSTRILGSGSLDAPTIDQLRRDGSPIDIFGVGDAMILGHKGTRPRLSYRICELTRGVDPTPVCGSWAAPWPGTKQVVRFNDHDTIILDLESQGAISAGGRPLLARFVSQGTRVREREELSTIRERRIAHQAELPAHSLHTHGPKTWEVRSSHMLQGLRDGR